LTVETEENYKIPQSGNQYWVEISARNLQNMKLKCQPLNCDTVFCVEVVTSILMMEAVGMLEMSAAAPYITHCYTQNDSSVYNRKHHEKQSGSYTFTFLAIM
jgi:hypothetical protein